MRHLLISALVIATVGLAVPAFAAGYHERCNVPKPGVHITFGMGLNKDGLFDHETQQDIDLMRLKQHGIDARSATRGSDGCIVAQVPLGNGHFKTEFYDPDTYDLKPIISGDSEQKGDALGVNRLFLNFN